MIKHQDPSFGKPVNLLKDIKTVDNSVNRMGAGVIVLMMFLTATDVCLRYFFNSRLIGGYDFIVFIT
jgi:TRAP-type C4-dicarboxylate transport system permease small subunit